MPYWTNLLPLLKRLKSRLGYLEEFPDYWTQAETEEELKENLIDVYKELTSVSIPNVRRVADLEIS